MFSLKKNSFVNISYVIYMIVVVILLCMFGMSYVNYSMVLIPVVVYPIGLIFSNLERIINIEFRRISIMLASIYAIIVLLAPNRIELIKSVPSVMA